MKTLTKQQSLIINNFLFNNFPGLWDTQLNEIFQEANINWVDGDEERMDDAIHNFLSDIKEFYIISMDTGEILYITTPQEILEGTAEPPAIPFSADDCELHTELGGADLGGNEAASDYYDTYCGYEMDNTPFGRWRGDSGMTTKNYQTGVYEHKPTWEGPWHDTRHILTIQMVDSAGRITDKFYGAQNDFNETFLAKCIRGEKFGVFCMDEQQKMVGVNRVAGMYHADAKYSFSMDKNLEWKMDECKKIQ